MIGYIYTIAPNQNDRDYMLWVYKEFKNLMYSTAYKYTSNPDTADDIVQDAIVNLLKKIDTIKPMARHILAGYIVATIRNTSINELKSRAYHNDNTSAYLDNDLLDVLSIDKLMLLAEQRNNLARIWPSLSSSEQYLLEGKYILGYSDEELAKGLSCKASSIRMKLTRARRRALTLLIEAGVENYDEA